MATLTIRLPDEQHARLKALAERRGLSLNKLIEEWSTRAIAEFDAETRFMTLAVRGDRSKGLALLDRLDAHFSKASGGR